MMIRNLIDHVNARKMQKERKERVVRWAVGFSIAVAAASCGVIVGMLYASKPGETLRTDLREGVTKTVDTIKKAVSDITDD